jgi:site-specific DNA-cytosine methylase
MRTVYVDLFSGIGGFALGACIAGLRFDRRYFSEIDGYAVQVYKKRFPEAVSLGDITKIDWREL